MLDIFLVLGFIAAIFLVERLGRIRLQLGGFVFMTVGLLVLALASGLKGGAGNHLVLVFAGFAIFNFFANAGPNATTYALPPRSSRRDSCCGSRVRRQDGGAGRVLVPQSAGIVSSGGIADWTHWAFAFSGLLR